jgi:hypothetical protein
MGERKKDDYPDAVIQPPQPIGYDINLPQVSVQSFMPQGAPRMGAMFDMGNYSLEGSYQPRDQRPDYSARLTYRRQF